MSLGKLLEVSGGKNFRFVAIGRRKNSAMIKWKFMGGIWGGGGLIKNDGVNTQQDNELVENIDAATCLQMKGYPFLAQWKK